MNISREKKWSRKNQRRDTTDLNDEINNKIALNYADILNLKPLNTQLKPSAYKLYGRLFFSVQIKRKKEIFGHPSSLAFHSVTVGRPTSCRRWLWKQCKLAEQTNVLWSFNSAIVSVMSWRIYFPARKIKCTYFTKQRLHFSFSNEKSILTVFIRMALSLSLSRCAPFFLSPPLNSLFFLPFQYNPILFRWEGSSSGYSIYIYLRYTLIDTTSCCDLKRIW